MKRLFMFAIVSEILAALGGSAHAATTTPWWQQPTICRMNPTDCYVGMGAGYDNGMWDAGGNCWGMKLICPEATVATNAAPVPMGRTEIAAGTGIKRDFDTDILNGDCFGVRKTTANGSMASVDGNFVNVWCNGVLDNVDETLPTGEITFGTQPTCRDLAPNGWVGVLAHQCYGKFYDPAQYFIECDGNSLLPKRLIVLNGADAMDTSGDYPTDTNAAKELFDKMRSVSDAQRAKYFKE